MINRRNTCISFANEICILNIAKSPVYTHLAATLNGLSTVRACNKQDILKREFDNHQDTHTACWYMVISTTSLFGLSLDIMCTILTAFITFYYMLIEPNASGVEIGLAVSQILKLGGLVTWGAIFIYSFRMLNLVFP